MRKNEGTCMRKVSIIKDPGFYRRVLVIMLPVAIQQAINMGVNMLDTMMLGSFGEMQLSASSLANQYYNFFTIFCMGIIGGSSVLSAQYWGGGNKEKTRETFNMAFRLAAGISLFFALLTWLFPRQIMTIYTSEPQVIEYGIKYLRITTFVFFIHGTSLVGAQLMRSVGKPRLGLYVSIVSFFFNLFFNWMFIFGKLGAPRMEIAGAALGTLLARLSEFAVTFWYILRKDQTLGLRVKDLKHNPSGEFFANYFRLGAPVLLSDGMLGLGNNVVSVVLGHMGAAVVAANAICMVIERLCTVIIQGVSNASGIIVGQTIGAGDKERALQQGETFYLLSMIMGAFTALMVGIFGPLSMKMYNLTPDTIIITKQLMMAHVFIVFFQCIQSVMTKGVLRGGGDTKFLMKADVLFLWAVSIPVGALAGLVLHWPAWLTMICLKLDLIIKSIWCINRLLSGKWIHEVDKKTA